MLNVIVFCGLSLLALTGALGVVVFKNPVNAAFSLILSLLAVAALFASLQTDFLAIAQVIVYAGAIMVMVLFVIMLLNIRSLPTRKVNAFLMSVGAALTSLTFVSPLIYLLFVDFEGAPAKITRQEFGSAEAIGTRLFTEYLVAFESATLLLLAALVAAGMITRRVKAGIELDSQLGN
ncbi:MAG TPA: NADH-quinone oxidoreductase subunit J [Oligoflexia bacterium]|nr:NADH-quinone oxidoreductase subunit J [Oligoflexia bacterium]HMP27586.1 NADH-quinone oxidoreductase subunit J [Oligoflexia bacterium]